MRKYLQSHISMFIDIRCIVIYILEIYLIVSMAYDLKLHSEIIWHIIWEIIICSLSIKFVQYIIFTFGSKGLNRLLIKFIYNVIFIFSPERLNRFLVQYSICNAFPCRSFRCFLFRTFRIIRFLLRPKITTIL